MRRLLCRVGLHQWRPVEIEVARFHCTALVDLVQYDTIKVCGFCHRSFAR